MNLLVVLGQHRACLDVTLSVLGMHMEARTFKFIISIFLEIFNSLMFYRYWLSNLSSFLKHNHVAFRFLPQKAYEQAAPLDVSPRPDIVTRILWFFEALLTGTLDTRLFRVIEWGGTEIVH